ncbi:CYTH domain-containing protein [Staphylococcus aureus]
MATNHEIEFKQMITASIYNKLQEKYFKTVCFLSKSITIFDTPDFKLKEHRSALRIRVKDNQYEMTLKTPAKVGLLDRQLISSTLNQR